MPINAIQKRTDWCTDSKEGWQVMLISVAVPVPLHIWLRSLKHEEYLVSEATSVIVTLLSMNTIKLTVRLSINLSREALV